MNSKLSNTLLLTVLLPAIVATTSSCRQIPESESRPMQSRITNSQKPAAQVSTHRCAYARRAGSFLHACRLSRNQGEPSSRREHRLVSFVRGQGRKSARVKWVADRGRQKRQQFKRWMAGVRSIGNVNQGEGGGKE
ncbi:hypothetical protein IE81DRAFT_135105 [Ceraceosorus guamensis]|uniref:Secreted protein n=1 Tax=Ceraceosorus guamensis TaxID=1522189 RepID=A0A316VXL3_9BASI|nr:hypothetical protein IE81DRAFT_135105 [Ceraceosorus guamensis]PWN42387.1 hypothetical protein IE81DRAFT_135105 [Ceraceosorus guamensis]